MHARCGMSAVHPDHARRLAALHLALAEVYAEAAADAAPARAPTERRPARAPEEDHVVVSNTMRLIARKKLRRAGVPTRNRG